MKKLLRVTKKPSSGLLSIMANSDILLAVDLLNQKTYSKPLILLIKKKSLRFRKELLLILKTL